MTDRGKHYLNPMIKIIEDVKDKGFIKEFKLKDGKLLDMEEEHSYKPNDLSIANEYRFEGTSDPEYMGILYTLVSTNGDKGYISNSYGTYADQELNDFIKQVEKSNNA